MASVDNDLLFFLISFFEFDCWNLFFYLIVSLFHCPTILPRGRHLDKFTLSQVQDP